MNADMEMALNGSNADMRAFVAFLRAAPQARVRDGFSADVMSAVEADARRSSMRKLFRPFSARRVPRGDAGVRVAPLPSGARVLP